MRWGTSTFGSIKELWDQSWHVFLPDLPVATVDTVMESCLFQYGKKSMLFPNWTYLVLGLDAFWYSKAGQLLAFSDEGWWMGAAGKGSVVNCLMVPGQFQRCEATDSECLLLAHFGQQRGKLQKPIKGFSCIPYLQYYYYHHHHHPKINCFFKWNVGPK